MRPSGAFSAIRRRIRAGRWASFWLGVALGVLVVWVGQTLAYLNWHPVVKPLDQHALMIRYDAKGDGRFGSPRSGNRHHGGVDLEAPVGSPVRAIRSGRVIEVGQHRGLGTFVTLEHARRLHSLYAHLKTVQVKVGARIRQGEVIATVGKTGNARHPWITPHLHLEVRQAGSPVDPSTLGLAMVEPVKHADDAGADGGE